MDALLILATIAGILNWREARKGRIEASKRADERLAYEKAKEAAIADPQVREAAAKLEKRLSKEKLNALRRRIERCEDIYWSAIPHPDRPITLLDDELRECICPAIEKAEKLNEVLPPDLLSKKKMWCEEEEAEADRVQMIDLWNGGARRRRGAT